MKRTVFVYLLIMSLFLVFAGNLVAQERPVPKQLAGPIDEMLTGVMAPVDPMTVGISSKSAMIPVELVQSKSGVWSWSGEIAVDSDQVNMMLFSGNESWKINIGQGDTKSMVPAHKLATSVDRTRLEMGNTAFEGDYYRFTETRPGTWKVSVEADAPLTGKGYLIYSTGGPYRALSYKTTDAMLVGSSIDFVSYGFRETAEGAPEKANLGMVEEASLRITAPGGKEITRTMFDDGRRGDALAGDGIFGGSFRADQAGEYHVQVVTRGTTPEGSPFTRTAEHVVPVIAPQVELALDVASARLVDDKRLAVSLPVNTLNGSPEKYRVFAEVWGADERGEMRPVSWIGGMSYVENGRLDLGLDLRWIGLSATRGDFELRNVRIEDPDTFIPVVRANRMELSTPELPRAAHIPPKGIDREMLVGPKPERAVDKTAGDKAAGGKLMLVHGYCSGDVWGPVSGQFSTNIKFQDFNQNRSHDAFAIRILNFGAGYPSFGVVAHSQGGAASLHLYTYYWSGLDDAGSGRLIQSVGTPYQGTSLAGNLAALGDIFGIGCGTNYDLTYSGASSWLSGIPTWARNAVNYYTTAFEDVWWRYDYCHLGSDLLLSDPEDGTTEKSKGQLSSGVNRGHKSKWCHTSGMRDPAQTTDSSRNSTSSSNAAR